MNSPVRYSDVLAFLAELAVYVALVWWGSTREVAPGVRGLLAVGGVVVFAGTWAVFSAPRATKPLRGPAGIAFRVAWFGSGFAVGLSLILGR